MLSKTCTQVCVEELSLQADHDFIVKVVQFQELLDVRHRYGRRIAACRNILLVRSRSYFLGGWGATARTVTSFAISVFVVVPSVMVLGPAGCGKTTVWKTLMACHNRAKPKPSTVAETVNPKVTHTTGTDTSKG